MSVRILTRADELEPLKEQWDALAAPFGTPVLSYDWLSACAQASAPPGRLKVFLLERDGELAAIAPLIAAPRLGVSTLHFLGDPYCRLCEASGFLYRDKHALRELIDIVVSERQPLRLDGISFGSADARILEERTARCVSVAPREQQSYFVPVESDWETFEKGLSKNRLHDLRRTLRKSEKIAPVRFEMLKPAPEDLAPHLERLIAIESSGWKARENSALTSNPYQRRFLELYSEAAARAGTLYIFQMLIGKRLAAAYITVEHASRLWGLKIGYDEEFRSCSPGILITHEILRYVFERQLEGYEFMGSDESWKGIWTRSKHRRLWYRIYLVSVAGTLGLIGDSYRSMQHSAARILSRVGNGGGKPMLLAPLC